MNFFEMITYSSALLVMALPIIVVFSCSELLRVSSLVLLSLKVCSHIVQGIRKESTKIREEWEASLINPNHIPQARSVLHDSYISGFV